MFLGTLAAVAAGYWLAGWPAAGTIGTFGLVALIYTALKGAA